MRLLLTIAEMGVGGAERVVVDLARDMRERGHTVAVAAVAGPLDVELEAVGGLERIVLPRVGAAPPGAAVSATHLARALRRFRPDVVHAHNVRATATAAIAARALVHRRPPVLATFHGVPPEQMTAAGRLLRLADEVVCVSDDLAERLGAEGFPVHRLSVIENAVPVPPQLPAERRLALDRELALDGGPVVSAVGRLVAQKAHGRYLEAASLVAVELPTTRFLLVGDGPLRAELEAYAQQLDITGRVTFTGVRDDARDVIARSDVVVFSSDWEGLSLVALEALAAATPIVATDVAGMRRLLAGGAGVLVAEPTPEALASAVLELLGDPQRRRAMGQRGRELISSRFSPERMTSAYGERYQRLAEGTGRTGVSRRALGPVS